MSKYFKFSDKHFEISYNLILIVHSAVQPCIVWKDINMCSFFNAAIILLRINLITDIHLDIPVSTSPHVANSVALIRIRIFRILFCIVLVF